MKKVLITLLLVVFVTSSFAQNTHFKKGDLYNHTGIGFLSPLLLTGADARFTIPPISSSFEYGITEAIGVGVYIATARSAVYSQKYSYIDDEYDNPYVKLGTFTHFIIGVRGAYHYELTPKLDTYLGTMLGYNKKVIKESQVRSEVGYKVRGLTYTIMVGGRFPVSEKIGTFLEIGYGVSVINLGITIKP